MSVDKEPVKEQKPANAIQKPRPMWQRLSLAALGLGMEIFLPSRAAYIRRKHGIEPAHPIVTRATDAVRRRIS